MNAKDSGSATGGDVGDKEGVTMRPGNDGGVRNYGCIWQLRHEEAADFNRAEGRIVIEMVDVDVELAGIDLEEEVRAAESEERKVRPRLRPLVIPDVQSDEGRHSARGRRRNHDAEGGYGAVVEVVPEHVLRA